MTPSPNRPEGTDIPLQPGVAHSPRWGLLAIIVVVTVLIVGLVAFAVARDDDGDGDAAGSPSDDLWGHRWEIVDVTVVDGDRTDGPDDSDGGDSDRPIPYDGEVADWLALLPMDGTLTIEFGEDRTVSFTGCNGGFGTVDVDGDRVTGVDLASTTMGCVDEVGEALMVWDDWFGRLLSDGVDVEVSDGRAVLVGEAGSVELLLEGPIEEREPADDPDAPVSNDSSSSSDSDAGSGDDTGDGMDGAGDASEPATPPGDDGDGGAAAPSLPDDVDPDGPIGRLVDVGRWTITGVEGPDAPTLEAAGPPTLSAELRDGGITVTVTGCNGAGVDFRIEGDRLMVREELPRTEMACEDALMQQDEWFRSFLLAEPRVALDTGDGDDLVVLRGPDHELLLGPD